MGISGFSEHRRGDEQFSKVKPIKWFKFGPVNAFMGLDRPIYKTLAFWVLAVRCANLLKVEPPNMASSKRTVLQFSSSQSLSGKVHPLVIFNICDCYVRRPDQAERVIGTLLGSVLPDGTVDIRNSYAVPHNESVDQVFHSPHLHSFL